MVPQSPHNFHTSDSEKSHSDQVSYLLNISSIQCLRSGATICAVEETVATVSWPGAALVSLTDSLKKSLEMDASDLLLSGLFLLALDFTLAGELPREEKSEPSTTSKDLGAETAALTAFVSLAP
jgi:hypothetical protein